MRIIPEDKIQGQRMGQLIANALYRSIPTHDGVNTAEFHQKLFYIENDQLDKLVQEFLNDMSWIRPKADTKGTDLPTEDSDGTRSHLEAQGVAQQPTDSRDSDELEQRLASELHHTLKLIPASQRELFVFELAKWYAKDADRLATLKGDTHAPQG